MEYQALYRKWRPMSFADVSGQEHITVTLKNEIAQGRIGHAYLFTGTRGTGKTTCAKIMAKAVNCLDPHEGEPCGKCENCRLFEADSLYDVLEIDAASKSRVEDIRTIIDEVVYAPATGLRKVYIIDEVQMMTANAFNALLKTLEEPPEYVVFILATTEVQKIPATILSRCQRFDFKRLSVPVISKRISYIAKEEGLELDADAAELIALLGDGAMRDALSILEQCQTAGHITRSSVLDTVGIAGSDEMLGLVSACAQGDIPGAMKILTTFYDNSKRMDSLLGELIGIYRDLLLIRMGAQGSVRRGKDEQEQFAALAKQLKNEYVFYCIDELTAAIAGATKNAGNLTVAQMCILRLCRPEFSDSLPAVSARLKELESSGISRRESMPKPIPSPAPVPTSAPEQKHRPDPVPLVRYEQNASIQGDAVPEPEAASVDAPVSEADATLPEAQNAPQQDAAVPGIDSEPVGADVFYAKLLEEIEAPNIRFFIPQSGKLESGTLYMYALTQSEYSIAIKPDTRNLIFELCAALGADVKKINVVMPGEENKKQSDAHTFSL